MTVTVLVRIRVSYLIVRERNLVRHFNPKTYENDVELQKIRQDRGYNCSRFNVCVCVMKFKAAEGGFYRIEIELCANSSTVRSRLDEIMFFLVQL